MVQVIIQLRSSFDIKQKRKLFNAQRHLICLTLIRRYLALNCTFDKIKNIPSLDRVNVAIWQGWLFQAGLIPPEIHVDQWRPARYNIGITVVSNK